MKSWTRRDVLKSGMAIPAAAALGVPSRTAANPLEAPLGEGDAEAVRSSGAGPGQAASGQAAAGTRPNTMAGRDRELLDFGWRFHFGHANDAAKDFGFGERQVGRVPEDRRLPLAEQHSPSTTATGRRWTCRTTGRSVCPSRTTRRSSSKGSYPLGREYPETSVGWYRRVFELPASDAGRRISVEFDGAYRDTMVVFNGYYIGRHGGGYDPFSFDVTDFAQPGERERAAGPRGRHAERRLVLRGRRHLPARLAGEDRAGPREEVGHARARQGAAGRGRRSPSGRRWRTTATAHAERARHLHHPRPVRQGRSGRPPARRSAIAGMGRAHVRAAGRGEAAGAVVAGAAEPLQAGDRGGVRRRRSPIATRRASASATSGSTPSRASS